MMLEKIVCGQTEKVIIHDWTGMKVILKAIVHGRTEMKEIVHARMEMRVVWEEIVRDQTAMILKEIPALLTRPVLKRCPCGP